MPQVDKVEGAIDGNMMVGNRSIIDDPMSLIRPLLLAHRACPVVA